MSLTRQGTEYVILASGKPLMSSRMHGSEEALASFGCARARSRDQPCVLVGGLGMGFTLRATLDVLPPDATVVVAELVPAVVEWNRGPLGPLANHPLRIKRVQVEIGDVAATLARQRAALRRRAARRRQRPGRVHRDAQHAAVRRSRPGGGAEGAQGRGRPGRLVGLGGPPIRAAPQIWRLHRSGRARARPAEERAGRATRSSSVTYNC